MADNTTKVMLSAYEQAALPTMFLAGMFQTPRINFHNSEEVEIDIVRSEEEVSIAITDISTGARLNSEDVYTSKGFKPPIHKEAGSITAYSLLNRMAGDNPYADVDFISKAIKKALSIATKLQHKILRAIELQASQVMTTGTVDLVDENGNTVYAIDYKPKATHFPTTGTAWTSASSTKLKDLEDLANVIRSDGLMDPDMIIMGERSYELFVADSDVQAKLDLRRGDMGRVVPIDRMGNGGIYRGSIDIGNYSYDLYTHAGRYKNPNGGASTKYIPDDKVVIRASVGRLDGTFGAIPRITNQVDPRIPSQLLQRVSVPGTMIDATLNAWFTPDSETMMIQAGTRPLLIPTAIDTFGCLDTGI